MKRGNYAVAGFAQWARALRNLGFRDAKLNEQLGALRSSRKLSFHAACEAIARENPGAPFSLHAIAHGFDYGHYDRCVNAFIARCCAAQGG